MSALTLISEGTYQVQPLIEAALEHESGFLKAGIRQTEARLSAFEEKYQRSTVDVIAAYENDQIEETLDMIEWMGEYQLLQRLREKFEALRSIHFVN